jgi:hypothetical protein
MVMAFWKKRIGSDQPSETIEPNPEVNLASSQKERCLAVFIFDADRASKRSGYYGSYIEGELLKALYSSLPTGQGWFAEPMFGGFHGDLFDSGIETVREWIRSDNCPVYMDSDSKKTLQSDAELHFIPYAIGIGTIHSAYAIRAHEALSSQSVAGYLGLLMPSALSTVTLGRSLQLPCDLRVDFNKCTGWLASADALRDAGLYKG